MMKIKIIKLPVGVASTVTHGSESLSQTLKSSPSDWDFSSPRPIPCKWRKSFNLLDWARIIKDVKIDLVFLLLPQCACKSLMVSKSNAKSLFVLVLVLRWRIPSVALLRLIDSGMSILSCLFKLDIEIILRWETSISETCKCVRVCVYVRGATCMMYMLKYLQRMHVYMLNKFMHDFLYV